MLFLNLEYYSFMDKQKLMIHLYKLVSEKIDQLHLQLIELDDAIAHETKSSAGDKYETNRELLNLEKGKYIGQLTVQKNYLKLIHQIKQEKTSLIIDFGTLIQTNNLYYLMGIPLGKIIFEGELLFCLGMHAPLSQLLKRRCKGDCIEFNNNTIEILSIH